MVTADLEIARFALLEFPHKDLLTEAISAYEAWLACPCDDHTAAAADGDAIVTDAVRAALRTSPHSARDLGARAVQQFALRPRESTE